MRTQLGHLRRWVVVLPTITVASWLAMLGALFGSWYTSGQPRYVSEEDTQSIAFISDIGAQNLKPVFITCTSLSMSTYLPTLIFYFYYMSPQRPFSSSPSSPSLSWSNSGLSRVDSLPSIYSTEPRTSLPPRQRLSQPSLLLHIIMPLISIVFSLIGATNLILLTIFDTARYTKAHQLLLPTSIGAHLLGCLILCIWSILCLHQYRSRQQQLQSSPYSSYYGGGAVYSGDKFTVDLYSAPPPQIPISIASLIVKAVIVAFEFGLVALFAVTTWGLKVFDMAAVMEWIVVLMFAGYMCCLIMDLWVLGRRRSIDNSEHGSGRLHAVDSSRTMVEV